MTSHTKTRLFAPALLLSSLLGSCGQPGPLYLPDKARDIITRPAQTPPQPPKAGDDTQPPNSPQTVDSPVTPPAAPEVTAPENDPRKNDKSKNATPPPK